MATPFSQIPALQPSDYLLILRPRSDLAADITEIRKLFSRKYKTHAPTKEPADITLIRFKQYRAMEPRISQRIRQLALEKVPLMIDLTDYGALPTHTIYINLGPRSAFQNLAKELRVRLQGILQADKDHKAHFISEPYIKIAGKLKPWQFEQGWKEFQQLNFSGRFIATELCLLRKDPDTLQYIACENFEFQGQPVRSRQTRLF